MGNSELRFYGEKLDNKDPASTGTITSESNTLDGKYVLPIGAINQLVTFGGEYRHDKLKDPVNLTGATAAKPLPISTRCSWKTNGGLSTRWR